MEVVGNEYTSEIFGRRMADLSGIREGIEAEEVRRAVDEATDAGYDHLAAKVPVSMLGTANTFLSAGFRLVDTQVEHAFRLSDKVGEIPCPEGVIIRDFVPSDLESLVRIAEESFSLGRWYSDPVLPYARCDRYYGTWVERSADGYASGFLVAEADGRPVGFLTLRDDGTDGRIDLTAVDRAYRLRGIYSALVNRALLWGQERGLTRMLAGTQIDNLGSRVTWAHAGFVPTQSWHVLHLPLG